MMYSPQERQGKRITVFVNGDRFMNGKVINLNPHDTPAFDKFCDMLTEKVPNRTGGCYNRLFTPGGSEVRALDQIEAGHEYVAAKDKYRRMGRTYGYKEISEQPRLPPHRKGFRKIDINRIFTPVQHALEERLRRKSGRSYYLNENARGLIVRVHINGMDERPACPVSILHKDRDNMSKIKETIQSVLNEKVYHTRPIDRLYKISNCGGDIENFSEVKEASQLEANEHILVMCQHEHKIQPKVYGVSGKNNFKVATSPRVGQYYLYDAFPITVKGVYKHNRTLNRHKPLPSIGSSSKKSDSLSPMSNPPSYGGGPRARNKNRGPGGGRHVKEVDYDRDEGGLYRSRQQNNARGAQQEEIHTKEKSTPIPPGTELNKQPSEQNKQSMDKDYRATQTKEDDAGRFDDGQK